MKRCFTYLTVFVLLAGFFFYPHTLIRANLDPQVALASLPFGSWEYWDDGSLDPGHRAVYGVDMLTPTDGWAVGNQLILHWNGSTWTKYASPTWQVLNDVVMAASNDVWAVGDDGHIIHWDGNTWSLHSPTPSTAGITKLSMVAPNDIWATAYYGKILHWNGTQWSEVASPVTSHLRSIDMLAANDGWAVGSSGKIIHWNGSAWSEVSSPTVYTIFSVSMISATDGWAVGDGNTTMRWNGTQWLKVVGVPVSSWGYPRLVKAYSDTNVYIVIVDPAGPSGLYHWNGSYWGYYGDYQKILLRGIDFVPGTSGQEAWVVGDATNIWHMGTGSHPCVSCPFADAINDVAMLSPNQGWAVTTNYRADGTWVGGGRGLNWDGTSWNVTDTVWGNAMAFSPESNGGDGWAVSNDGLLRHWNGSTWEELASPTNMDRQFLQDIDLLSASDGWAVGAGIPLQGSWGGLLTRLQGGSWSEYSTTYPGKRLNGVDLVSAQDGWAVGDSGLMLHWDGSAWVTAPAVTTLHLNNVAMLSASDGFAIGQSGTILRWNGSTWNSISSPTTRALYGIHMLSPVAGWAVGDQRILYWDGISWAEFSRPAGILYSVRMSSYTDGWASGSPGILLHYTAPAAQLTINYDTGQAGSYFTLTGTHFPPNSTANISINNHPAGSVVVNTNGSFSFLLNSTGAATGLYVVTASVNPSASVRFTLDPSAPLREMQLPPPQIIQVPPGIAYDHTILLPGVIR